MKIQKCLVCLKDYVWSELLSNRGPDLHGSCHVNMHVGPKFDHKIKAEFYGHVLHLRGSPTQQPLNDSNGNILLWNGEIFGGDFHVYLIYYSSLF